MYIKQTTSIDYYLMQVNAIITDNSGNKDGRLWDLFDKENYIDCYDSDGDRMELIEYNATTDALELVNRLIEDTFDGLTVDYTSVINAIDYIYNARLYESIDWVDMNEPDSIESLGLYGYFD